jgi:hypothetical protein
MKAIIGIDFGNTTTQVKHNYGTGDSTSIGSRAGFNPTIFAIDTKITDISSENEYNIYIGTEAQKLEDPSFSKYYNFKTKIGLDELSTMKAEIFLKELSIGIRADLDGANINDDYEIVIGIPVKWHKEQLDAYFKIAKNVGFKDILLVPEPIAAILGAKPDSNRDRDRGFEELTAVDKDRKLLFFDFGGGTLDLSIVKIPKGKTTVEFIYSGGNPQLGGTDITKLMLESLINKYELSNLTDYELTSLESQLNSIKEKISDKIKAGGNTRKEQLTLRSKRYIISYDELDKTRGIIQDRIFATLDELFEKAEIPKSEVLDIIKIGGASKMYYINDILKEYFGDRIEINGTFQIISPEEAVSKGLASYYKKREAILVKHTEEYKIKFNNIKDAYLDRLTEIIEDDYHACLNDKIEKIFSDFYDNRDQTKGITTSVDKMINSALVDCHEKIIEKIEKLFEEFIENQYKPLLKEANEIIKNNFGKFDYILTDVAHIKIAPYTIMKPIEISKQILPDMERFILRNSPRNNEQIVEFINDIVIAFKKNYLKYQISKYHKKFVKHMKIIDHYNNELKYERFWDDFQKYLNIGGIYESK